MLVDLRAEARCLPWREGFPLMTHPGVAFDGGEAHPEQVGGLVFSSLAPRLRLSFCAGLRNHRRGGVRILAALFEERREPAFIRSDNGPEFIAEAIKRWFKVSWVGTLYIEAD
jgi:hypothetical protein